MEAIKTASEHLENIRAVSGLTVPDLAGILGISRPAIYKWLSGESKPKPEKFDRIQALSHITDTFKEAGITRIASFLKMKTFDGYSLLDIIKAGGDYSRFIDTLISEARLQERAYERSELKDSKAEPTSDWQTSQSIPTLYED